MLRYPDVGVYRLELAQVTEKSLHVVQRGHDAVSAHHLDATMSLELRHTRRALPDLDLAALLDRSLGFERGLSGQQMVYGRVREEQAYSELDDRPRLRATACLAIVGVHPTRAILVERAVDFLGERQRIEGRRKVADEDACIVWVDALRLIETLLDGCKLLVRV